MLLRRRSADQQRLRRGLLSIRLLLVSDLQGYGDFK